MNILNNLTIKHLTMNKRRTIVSIVGIILSTALMVGIGLLFSSALKVFLEDAIESYGSHNVIFENLSEKDYEVLNRNLNVEKTGFTTTVGFAKLENGANEYKPYIFLQGGNKDYLKTLPLLKGRLPKNESEIVIANHINNDAGLNLEIGQTITLNLGKRFVENEEVIENVAYDENEVFNQETTKDFKIVGIIERNYSLESYEAAGYSAYTFSPIEDNKLYNAYVTYKKPSKTYKITPDLKKSLDTKDVKVKYNDNLLYYYGASRYNNVNNAIMSMLAIALSILSVGCAIVIYNSFAISTMERKKQFGLLSSIGATKKQIKNTVLFEATLVGIIGIILGILSAFLGIGILLKVLNHLLAGFWDYHFSLVFNFWLILIPILFMVVVILISAFIPAKRASKISPIEAIRLNDDIKINKKKIKTSKLIQKVFGVEGEIALKNIKRNKRKYRITIISLFISIVLFITFSTYLVIGVNSVDTMEFIDYDAIYSNSGNIKEVNKNIDIVKSYDEVEKSTIYDTVSFDYKINKNILTKDYLDYINQVDESTLFNYIDIIGLDKESYQEYIKTINAKEENLILINKSTITTYKNNERSTKEIKYINENKFKELDLCRYIDEEYDEDEKESVCDYKLDNIVFTNKTPYGLKGILFDTSITIITTLDKKEDLEKQLGYNNNSKNEVRRNLAIKSSKYEKLDKKLSKFTDDKDNMYYGIPAIEMKEQRNLILAIKILLYGFIGLITLIGVTSVFNTISTSIMLRQKEFAMLRSMGLTPRGFNKILLFESIFFGFKALLYALPVSIGLVVLLNMSFGSVISFSHLVIPYKSIIISIVGVFILVLVTMLYSSRKLKKENILETIREENI